MRCANVHGGPDHGDPDDQETTDRDNLEPVLYDRGDDDNNNNNNNKNIDNDTNLRCAVYFISSIEGVHAC